MVRAPAFRNAAAAFLFVKSADSCLAAAFVPVSHSVARAVMVLHLDLAAAFVPVSEPAARAVMVLQLDFRSPLCRSDSRESSGVSRALQLGFRLPTHTSKQREDKPDSVLLPALVWDLPQAAPASLDSFYRLL